MRCLMMFKHSVKNLISIVTEKHFMFSAPHWWGFFPKIGLRKYTNFCQRHLTAVCLMLPTKWVTGHWCLDIHCDPRKFHWATTWVTPLSYPMRLRTLLFYSALWYWLLGFYNDPNVFKCLLDQWDNRFKGITWGACRNPLLQTLSVKDQFTKPKSSCPARSGLSSHEAGTRWHPQSGSLYWQYFRLNSPQDAQSSTSEDPNHCQVFRNRWYTDVLDDFREEMCHALYLINELTPPWDVDF